VLLKLMGILLAVSALGSLSMVYLALRSGDVNGALLFFGFVLLLGFPAVACSRRWNQCSDDSAGKDAELPAPVKFVPHWFMMAALILTAMAILVAIGVPLVLR
jgi:hypothetical protein